MTLPAMHGFQQSEAPHPRPAPEAVSLGVAPATGRSAVEFWNIGKSYSSADGGPIEALRDINLKVASGEFLTIVGPSGCGKSSLLRILAGIERPSTGAILFNGRESTGPSKDIGVVFQSPVLMPWRTVIENALVVAQVQRRDRKESRERARDYLRMVGLAEFENRYPAELSGGMQQRVGIVRALVNQPSLLLMDEPFGALDAMTREQMNLEMLRLARASGATVILVTHSIPEAVFLGSRVVAISDRPGQIKEVVDVQFSRERTLDLINTPDFGVYVSHIRRMLNANGGLD